MAFRGKLANKLIAAIPVQYQIRLFRRLAWTLGVTSFSAQGELGNFEGDARDSVVHEYYLQHRTWASGFQLLLSRVFASGEGTYLDIGANIGLTLIPIAKKKGVRCFGFEAAPNTFMLLQRNLLCNAIGENVHVFNVALFDRKGSVEMELSDSNVGDHRLRGNGKSTLNAYAEANRKTIQVSADQLDAVMGQVPWRLGGPNFMKLDVQGAEVRVLRGAYETLSQMDFLYLEYWPYGILRMGDPIEELTEFIKTFEFGFIFDDSSLHEVSTLKPIEAILEEINRLPRDGTTTDHRNLLLSRVPEIKTSGNS
jgi:FkbM family methyltransferase